MNRWFERISGRIVCGILVIGGVAGVFGGAGFAVRGALAGEAGVELELKLEVADREVEALSGTALEERIRVLPVGEREEVVFTEIMRGNIPDFLRRPVPVRIREEIEGVDREVVFYVTPGYLAVGSDEDHFVMPMTPVLAQRLATAFGCSLPTRKMVDAIWREAPLKLVPKPIPPSAEMVTVPVFAEHNRILRRQMEAVLEDYPLGTLVGGGKKDLVISNQTKMRPPPARVTIYGWHRENGVPIQPLSSVHESMYVDYSHGVRLVLNEVWVDGKRADLRELLRDPVFSRLVSDEGVILESPYLRR